MSLRPAPQRPFVVLNPRAHGGGAETRWAAVEPPLRARFPTVEVLRTTKAGEEAELARRAVREGADLVIAAGGDGTLSGVVDGLLSEPPPTFASRTAVALLPVGTGSDFARGRGLPRDPVACVPRLAATPPVELDVGRMTFSGETPPRVRHWINQSYIGFGARVVARVNRSPGPRKESAYRRAVLPELWHHRPTPVRFDGPGVPPSPFDLSNLVVALGRYSGGGMLSSPLSDPSDGAFDMIAVGPVSRLRLLLNLSRFRTGKHLRMREVTTWRAPTLTVSPEPGGRALVEADGDVVGELPVSYEILPRGLTFWG